MIIQNYSRKWNIWHKEWKILVVSTIFKILVRWIWESDGNVPTSQPPDAHAGRAMGVLAPSPWWWILDFYCMQIASDCATLVKLHTNQLASYLNRRIADHDNLIRKVWVEPKILSFQTDGISPGMQKLSWEFQAPCTYPSSSLMNIGERSSLRYTCFKWKAALSIFKICFRNVHQQVWDLSRNIAYDNFWTRWSAIITSSSNDIFLIPAKVMKICKLFINI